MPENIQIHIKSINDKLQLLLKKHELLLKENAQLRQLLGQFETGEKKLKQENERLQQQLFILKTAANELDGKEKSDFEKKINGYIRSIDKCITLLK